VAIESALPCALELLALLDGGGSGRRHIDVRQRHHRDADDVAEVPKSHSVRAKETSSATTNCVMAPMSRDFAEAKLWWHGRGPRSWPGKRFRVTINRRAFGRLIRA